MPLFLKGKTPLFSPKLSQEWISSWLGVLYLFSFLCVLFCKQQKQTQTSLNKQGGIDDRGHRGAMEMKDRKWKLALGRSWKVLRLPVTALLFLTTYFFALFVNCLSVSGPQKHQSPSFYHLSIQNTSVAARRGCHECQSQAMFLGEVIFMTRCPPLVQDLWPRERGERLSTHSLAFTSVFCTLRKWDEGFGSERNLSEGEFLGAALTLLRAPQCVRTHHPSIKDLWSPSYKRADLLARKTTPAL